MARKRRGKSSTSTEAPVSREGADAAQTQVITAWTVTRVKDGWCLIEVEVPVDQCRVVQDHGAEPMGVLAQRLETEVMRRALG